jgi:uncharacterized lipoprotein YddW (UPF0748 family)
MGKSVLSLLFALLLAATSCGSSDGDTPAWAWGNDSTSTKAKPRYIWIDACANFPDYANSKDNIERDLTKVKNAGFTDIVVDVRPSMGDALFSTSAVDQVTKLDVWIGLGEQGMLFRDSSKKGWATTLNMSSGLTNEMDLNSTNDPDNTYGTKFLNPANDDVQTFALQLLKDLAKYNLDGIFLDRCRYDDMMSDFSDESRQKFESYIGTKVTNYPSDIMLPGTTSLPSTQPTYFKKWLEFRVKVIHDFVVKARAAVKSVNDTIKFGTYVGAWYSTYYESGVNWASPKYNTAADYPTWATADYSTYGYADHLDFMLLGAYASTDNIYGTGEWTMQGFCTNATNLLKGDVKFAGGPDVGNATGWTNGGQSAKIPQTVDACINAGNGYFLFDICHVKKYDYWAALKTGIDNYLKTVK